MGHDWLKIIGRLQVEVLTALVSDQALFLFFFCTTFSFVDPFDGSTFGRTRIFLSIWLGHRSLLRVDKGIPQQELLACIRWVLI